MLRHGAVHEQKWKSIRLQDGLEVAVRVTKGLTGTHLDAEQGTVGTPWEKTLWLNVDVGQLWADIKSSVAAFLADLAQDQRKLEISITAMGRLIAPDPESTVRSRKYVGQADLQR